MIKHAAALALSFLFAACALENMSTGSGKGAAADGGTKSDAGDAGAIQGAGCGTETESGLALCAATSKCPNLVVDTQVFPSCGFRIQGTAVDLVCGCNGSICSMGAFTTCAQAAELLTSQTQQTVCMQVAEGRCTTGAPAPASTAKSTCDRQCLSECGGGAGCASLCGC